MGDALPVYHFGAFQLDPGERRLLRRGEPVSLPPKPFDLLVTLVEHRGHLVEKATLIQALWPDAIVEEANLTFQVFTLRKVLDEDGNGDSMIQTVPTKGYRFVAAVTLKGPTQPERLRWAGRSVAALLTLGCIGALAGLMSRECDAPLSVPPEVRPLTTLPGDEGLGSLSPDGQTVAFLWDGGKDWPLHLHIKRVDSSAIRRVTSGTDPEGVAAWSPDARQLAYLRFRGRTGRVHIISVADGEDHTVGDFPAARFARIDWSPDGRTLVAAKSLQNVDGSPIGGLYLIPVQGGEPRQITWPERWEAHTSPAFSPDGRSIAFVSCKGNECDAYVIALNADLTSTGTPRRLTWQAGWAMTRLTWTHDGKEIIYDVFMTPSVMSLWRMAVDGTASPRRIESAGFRAHGAMVARNSDRLVFTRSLDDSDIYRLQVGEASDNWFTSSFSDDSPAYSQDGKRVVFATSSSGVSEEIWIAESTAPTRTSSPMDRGGGKARRASRQTGLVSPSTRAAVTVTCTSGPSTQTEVHHVSSRPRRQVTRTFQCGRLTGATSFSQTIGTDIATFGDCGPPAASPSG